MKINYQPDEVVSVKCTDTGRVAEGTLLDERDGKMRVDVSGVVMNFMRVKSGVYVANQMGLEFVIEK